MRRVIMHTKHISAIHSLFFIFIMLIEFAKRDGFLYSILYTKLIY